MRFVAVAPEVTKQRGGSEQRGVGSAMTRSRASRGAAVGVWGGSARDTAAPRRATAGGGPREAAAGENGAGAPRDGAFPPKMGTFPLNWFVFPPEFVRISPNGAIFPSNCSIPSSPFPPKKSVRFPPEPSSPPPTAPFPFKLVQFHLYRSGFL